MTTVLWFVALSAALFCAVAELVSRWWIRRRALYYVFPPGLRIRVQIDRDALPQLEREARFEINADGERGDNAPRSSDGLYRVLVAGGSQTEGYFLDQSSSWPGVLQAALDQPAARSRLNASSVHVGSIARSGVGSEGLDLMFEHLLPRYRRLQLIVVSVGASDVMHWLEQGTPAVIAPPVGVSDVFMCHPQAAFGWTPGRLALTELARRARRRWLRPVEVHERAGAWVHNARIMRAQAADIRTSVPDPSPMLDHFEFHFRKLLAKALAHADRVIVVPQPWFDKNYSAEEASQMWHGGAGQVWRQNVTTFYSFDVFNKLMAAVNARAVRIAGSCGVELFDVSPFLESSLRTYYDGAHLTPFGARTVAEALTAAILRERIPQSTMPLRAAG